MSEAPLPLPPAPAARRELSDVGAVALAVATALGAWWHGPVPWAPPVAMAVLALLWRRPWLLVVAGLALGAALGYRSHGGLTPVEPRSFEGEVTLVADPSTRAWGTTADARVDGARVELVASGGAAGALEQSLAGERLRVRGRLARPPPNAPWLVPRHIVGRLNVTSAERIGSGTVAWRGANRFRRLLDRGSQVLPRPTRSLYAGFVLGDGRDQPAVVVDDFRGAGLTHLLVVSGQNVAFILVLASPFTTRLGGASRWLAVLGVIGAFALVTRFEPSVLRASVMAALATSATAVGRPLGSVRILALAVTVLVLADPLLVLSIAFQLSVGASLAIAVLGGPLARRLPGPRLVAEAVAVTVAAQLGVAPVLIGRFDGIPVVSLVANLVAVPVAGLVTTWGLPAGIVAGLAGPPVATWVHAPTALLVGWVAEVARVGSSLRLGEAQAEHVLVAGAAMTTALVVRWVPVRLVALAVLVIALAMPTWVLRRPPTMVETRSGTVVTRVAGHTRVELPSRVSTAAVLADLRRSGVSRIDVLVVSSGSASRLVAALQRRWRVGQVQRH